MLAVDRTMQARITCLKRKTIVCTRHRHTQPVEVLTFTLDGITPVWIEQDETKYNVKIGADDIHLMQTEAQVLQILGEL